MKEQNIRIVIITGLSGSGKTTTLKVLEDIGFYCIDNLPPILLPEFIRLCEGFTWHKIQKIGLGMDIRGGEFLKEYPAILAQLQADGYKPEILFLDSSDEALVRRFSETRRHHPLASEGPIITGITMERERLAELRENAHMVIDTSKYTVHQLKENIFSTFNLPTTRSKLNITITSFGYRYGIPYEADIVMDVRFVSNPFFVDALRALSGKNEKVREFVLGKQETKSFLKKFEKLLTFLIPLYEKEGKSNLTIAIGCTGGRHRSVSIVCRLTDFLDTDIYNVNVLHRDIDKS